MVLVEAPTLGEGWLAVSRDDPRERRRRDLGRLTDPGGRAADARRRATRLARRADRGARRSRVARLDAPELLRARGGAGARPGAELRAAALRLRRQPGATRSPGSSNGCAPTRSAATRRSRPSSRWPTRRYIPCVSMLDFWLRDGAVELVVYAHSLDFGKKAYGNLVELAHLQEHVAGELGADRRPARRPREVGAHLREPELAAMAELAAQRERDRLTARRSTGGAPRARAPARPRPRVRAASSPSPRIASLRFSSSSR